MSGECCRSKPVDDLGPPNDRDPPKRLYHVPRFSSDAQEENQSAWLPDLESISAANRSSRDCYKISDRRCFILPPSLFLLPLSSSIMSVNERTYIMVKVSMHNAHCCWPAHLQLLGDSPTVSSADLLATSSAVSSSAASSLLP
jgi:hypothetical protein